MTFFKEDDKVLELGGGEHPRYRPNLDIRPGPTVDIVANLEETFPIESGTYDGVYAQFIIEHISWRKIPDFIRECYRVLKHDGKVIYIMPNLFEQAKKLASSDEWDFNDVGMIFGDQNYPDNTHKAGFSPKMISQILKEIGFKKVSWAPLPNCITDMVVIAEKGWEKDGEYEIEYFDGGDGAPYNIYLDFPVHWNTTKYILDKEPENAINFGGARGYVSKHLQEAGVPTVTMDISQWCYTKRVTDAHLLWDMTILPYPFKDKQFDLGFSVATLEHLPENSINGVIREIARICKRSVHAITFEITEEDIDHTHEDGTIKPKDWWESKFESLAPDHEVEILDKEEIELGSDPYANMPESDEYLKLNLGSFMDMFAYGWRNIDILPIHDVGKYLGCKFTQYDVTKKIREKDDTVDCIVTSHMLEHLSRAKGKFVLEDALRVLKPGGVIRIATPDLRKICSKYLDGSIGHYGIFDKGIRDAEDDALRLWLTAIINHQTVYDGTSLVSILETIGFEDVHISEFCKSKSDIIKNQTCDLHPEISIYVEARKPR